MCSPAQPLPFSRCGANRQAHAWPWLMTGKARRVGKTGPAAKARSSNTNVPSREGRRAEEESDAQSGQRIERSPLQRRRSDAMGTVTTTTTAPAIPVIPAQPATPAGIDWGIRLSWKAIAGFATVVGLVLLGIKAVTYTNNLAHSITTLAEAVGKLDGTIGTVTSDIVAIKQRMAAYDATQSSRQAETADILQRQQRMEQALADLRADVAAATAGRK